MLLKLLNITYTLHITLFFLFLRSDLERASAICQDNPYNQKQQVEKFIYYLNNKLFIINFYFIVYN